MTFKIYFSIGDYEDDFTVSGETIEDIRAKAHEFFESRGIDENNCNPWSEEVK